MKLCLNKSLVRSLTSSCVRSQVGSFIPGCLQLFRQRLSHKSVKAYATKPIGIMGRMSLALTDIGLPTRKRRHK